MKTVTNMHKKLTNKRNRDTRLKERRKDYVEMKGEMIKRNQAILDSYDPTVSKKIPMVKASSGVNEKFLERVINAQKTYNSMYETCESSDAVVCILDARDPNGCRFINVEDDTKSKSKPFLYIVNKVDLVPREVAEKWVKFLNLAAPTVAVSLKSEEVSKKVLEEFFAQHAPECKNFAVIGAPSVGKSLLVQYMGDTFHEVEKWLWTMCNHTLALINAVPWKGRMREFVIGLFERMQGQEIFSYLSIKPDENPGQVLSTYGQKHAIERSRVPDAILENFIDGKWCWYSIPPEEGSSTEFSSVQMLVFDQCSSIESEKYVKLSPDTTVAMDMKALEYEIPTEEEEESDYKQDGEEDTEEEEKDE